jgi:hypothetical protein
VFDVLTQSSTHLLLDIYNKMLILNPRTCVIPTHLILKQLIKMLAIKEKFQFSVLSGNFQGGQFRSSPPTRFIWLRIRLNAMESFSVEIDGNSFDSIRRFTAEALRSVSPTMIHARYGTMG